MREEEQAAPTESAELESLGEAAAARVHGEESAERDAVGTACNRAGVHRDDAICVIILDDSPPLSPEAARALLRILLAVGERGPTEESAETRGDGRARRRRSDGS